MHIGRPANAKNRLKKLDEYDYLIGSLLMQGASISEIAKKTDTTWGTVKRYVKEKYAI